LFTIGYDRSGFWIILLVRVGMSYSMKRYFLLVMFSFNLRAILS
jgi:hypothetical protein